VPQPEPEVDPWMYVDEKNKRTWVSWEGAEGEHNVDSVVGQGASMVLMAVGLVLEPWGPTEMCLDNRMSSVVVVHTVVVIGHRNCRS